MASPGSVEFVAAVVAARGDEAPAATAGGSPEDGPSHVPRPQGSLHVSGRGSNPPDFTPYFLLDSLDCYSIGATARQQSRYGTIYDQLQPSAYPWTHAREEIELKTARLQLR